MEMEGVKVQEGAGMTHEERVREAEREAAEQAEEIYNME